MQFDCFVLTLRMYNINDLNCSLAAGTVLQYSLIKNYQDSIFGFFPNTKLYNNAVNERKSAEKRLLKKGEGQ